MSDDLVKRLLASRSVWTNETGRALSRPSDLEAEAAAALVAKDAENARLRGAMRFYADFYENPNDGPWGVNSQDFGKVARAALNTQHKEDTP